jgi:hypothetical protein
MRSRPGSYRTAQCITAREVRSRPGSYSTAQCATAGEAQHGGVRYSKALRESTLDWKPLGPRPGRYSTARCATAALSSGMSSSPSFPGADLHARELHQQEGTPRFISFADGARERPHLGAFPPEAWEGARAQKTQAKPTGRPGTCG